MYNVVGSFTFLLLTNSLKIRSIFFSAKLNKENCMVMVLSCSYFFVCICGFHYWSFYAESCLALCSRVFVSVLCSIVITSLGKKRAGRYMCFSCYCLFILHAFNLVPFCFLLASGVGWGLC